MTLQVKFIRDLEVIEEEKNVCHYYAFGLFRVQKLYRSNARRQLLSHPYNSIRTLLAGRQIRRIRVEGVKDFMQSAPRREKNGDKVLSPDRIIERAR